MGYVPSFVGEGGRSTAGTSARTKPGARGSRSSTRTAPTARNSSPGSSAGFTGKGKIVAAQSHELTDVDVNGSDGLAEVDRCGTPPHDVHDRAVRDPVGFIGAEQAGVASAGRYVASPSIEPTLMQTSTLSAGGGADDGGHDQHGLPQGPDQPALQAKDPGVRLYKEIMRRYAPGRKATGTSTTSTAWRPRSRWWMRSKRAGRNLTRDGPPPRGDASERDHQSRFCCRAWGRADVADELLPDLERSLPALPERLLAPVR